MKRISKTSSVVFAAIVLYHYQKPEETILTDRYSEKDLETSIIAELQHFITELGNCKSSCKVYARKTDY